MFFMLYSEFPKKHECVIATLIPASLQYRFIFLELHQLNRQENQIVLYKLFLRIRWLNVWGVLGYVGGN